jgi:hypothetical protein
MHRRLGPFIPQKKLLANVDLANLLQQKAFERLSVPVFHKNVENLVDFRPEVCVKSRFSRAL